MWLEADHSSDAMQSIDDDVGEEEEEEEKEEEEEEEKEVVEEEEEEDSFIRQRFYYPPQSGSIRGFFLSVTSSNKVNAGQLQSIEFN